MPEQKTAFITGATGQDGAYLIELLLAKGYAVHGLKRRSSSFNTGRIDRFLRAASETGAPFHLHHGDMTDTTNLLRLLDEIRPDEVYNLAGQSHVRVSFEMPEYTADVNAIGALRLLEALRILRLDKTARFYQAATSELYGNTPEAPQNETTPFRPRSPYGIAKLYAYWTTVNYREAYGFHASNGILFNHESPLRGETFVSRKVTRGVAAIEHGFISSVAVGNLDAERDWGHVRDYVEGMWRMLQQADPDDYVLATGSKRSVRFLIELAFGEVGRRIVWEGKGIEETGRDAKSGQILVRVDPWYFRPAEVDLLVGDASKAERKLGWKAVTSFEAMIAEMVAADLKTVAYEYQAERRS